MKFKVTSNQKSNHRLTTKTALTKILACLLSTGMVISLAACGQDRNTADGTPACLLTSNFRYGIMSRSKHKEGAWEFLQYYLLTQTDGSGGDGITWSNGFPSLKQDFEKKVDDAARQTKDTFRETQVSYAGIWSYTYHIPTQEDVDTIKTLVSCAKPYSPRNGQALGIILEEASPYFQGQKSLDEVINVMQNRVGIYMSENP